MKWWNKRLIEERSKEKCWKRIRHTGKNKKNWDQQWKEIGEKRKNCIVTKKEKAENRL